MKYQLGAAAFAVLTLYGTVSRSADAAPSTPSQTGLHRLSSQQYRNSIHDIFGTDIEIKGRFEPEVRQDGLVAIGLSSATVTPSGAESYVAMARVIAGQVVDEKHRKTLLPCAPQDAKKPDTHCASLTLAKYGRLLFRRPLTAVELNERIDVTTKGAKLLGDYYQGLAYGLATLISAPQFLFREDIAEPAKGGAPRLTPYATAARLSYFLWNTTPDQELLSAADTRQIMTEAGYSKQVDRLMSSPRMEAGVRAFFSDMLAFEGFAELTKDSVIYPQVKTPVIADASEETLRTIVDLLVTQKGDYRDLFTTRTTFLTRNLGYAYRIPVPTEDGWMRYTYPDGAEYAGILSQFSFTALHSHPGRSSATLRGKAIRELLMCQSVPKPPGNVNFTVVQDTNNPQYKTARERLTAHRTNPVCAGCHRITDPMGLALENYDGSGMYRVTENGAVIDASGDLDGKPFKDVNELGQVLHDSPQIASCAVTQAYGYAVGRAPTGDDDKAAVTKLRDQFVQQGYQFTKLLRDIAMSDAFSTAPKASIAEVKQPNAKTALNLP